MEKLKTLKAIKGYTDPELKSIAQIAYFMMMQGKMDDAQTLFEGLVAIDPTDEYYYRALGVLAQKREDSHLALRHFGFAIQLAPQQPHGYVNRAEVYIYLDRKHDAETDLQEALGRMSRQDQMLSQKAWALYRSLKTA
ncbi:MAG: CesD/SycD/LcrH family type III secretion system chaperone [Myxococcota bacterium]